MVAELSTTFRTLRQPDVSGYEPRPLWTTATLDAALNDAFDAVLASGGDTLTAGQWERVFMIYDLRRLLDAGDVAFVASVMDEVRS